MAKEAMGKDLTREEESAGETETNRTCREGGQQAGGGRTTGGGRCGEEDGGQRVGKAE